MKYGTDVGPYTAECGIDGKASIVVAVHDGSFNGEVSNSNEYGCPGWPQSDGHAVYNVDVPCCVNEGTAAPVTGKTPGPTAAPVPGLTSSPTGSSCVYEVTSDDTNIPFPDGAIVVSGSDGNTVTYEIVQVWITEDSISWINSIYIPASKTEQICLDDNKDEEIPYGDKVGPFTAQCFNGKAGVLITVHDGSFKEK